MVENNGVIFVQPGALPGFLDGCLLAWKDVRGYERNIECILEHNIKDCGLCHEVGLCCLHITLGTKSEVGECLSKRYPDGLVPVKTEDLKKVLRAYLEEVSREEEYVECVRTGGGNEVARDWLADISEYCHGCPLRQECRSGVEGCPWAHVGSQSFWEFHVAAASWRGQARDRKRVLRKRTKLRLKPRDFAPKLKVVRQRAR